MGRRLWEGEGTMTEQVRNELVQGQLEGPGGKRACLPYKPSDLSLIPETHVQVEGADRLRKAVLLGR